MELSHFKVIASRVVLAIEATDPGAAIDTAIEALGRSVDVQEVWSVRVDEADLTAEPIEFDPQEVAEMEAWLATKG